MSKQYNALFNTVLSAVFAAIIAVFTAFVKFNTGINEGYLHFGDSAVYLGACILPLPYSCLAAAVGGAIADLLAGSALWAPFTAIIKAGNALIISLMYSKINKKKDKILSRSSAAASVVSGVFTVLGYLLAEGLLFSFPTAVTSVPFSIIQAAGSSVIFILIASALDKAGFKKKYFKE